MDKIIISDRGTNFTSKIVKEVNYFFSTDHYLTSPYHPQTNGLTEKTNHTLCRMITHYVQRQNKWDLVLPMITFAYNSANNSSTRASFYLIYGREPTLPVDLSIGLKRASHSTVTKRKTLLTTTGWLSIKSLLIFLILCLASPSMEFDPAPFILWREYPKHIINGHMNHEVLINIKSPCPRFEIRTKRQNDNITLSFDPNYPESSPSSPSSSPPLPEETYLPKEFVAPPMPYRPRFEQERQEKCNCPSVSCPQLHAHQYRAHQQEYPM
ncbi:uncharacterized protein LOC128395803 [Panonychus citri]|uniref:uncharacterized protein LOC128395803 n=1 Tax=Panonychus citri TaxID=50023 RepID=UPI002306E1EC|nr:uncharacterized protein LOC128395803 [Panonychus citri]